MPTEAQSQMLKTQYARISKRLDRYRAEAEKILGLVTEDGIVPMGVREAVERVEGPKPRKAPVKPRRKVKPGKKPGVLSRLLGALFRRKG